MAATRAWISRHRAVIVATLILAASYIAFVAWNHGRYETHAFDLGIFTQAVWHLGRFELPASTVRDVANLFGDHFHPIIALFAPWTWIFPADWVLVIGQAILLALTLPASYALARQLQITPRAALVAAIAAGSAPGFAPALGFDVHEIAFAAPLIPLVFLFTEQRRWKLLTATTLLLLLTKESMGFYLAAIGLTVIIRRRFKAGLALVGVGIIYTLLVTSLVLPRLNPEEGFRHWERYEHLAASPVQMPVQLIAHPGRFMNGLADAPEKREFVAATIGGAGLLPLLGLAAWPLLGLSLLEVVWSGFPSEWSFGFHYALLPSIAASVGAIYGLAWLSRRQTKRYLALIGAIVMAVGTIAGHLGTPSFRIIGNENVAARPTAVWNEALKRIPADASVSASDAFVPRLAEREVIYRYPRIREAQWIIIDPRAPSYPYASEQIRTEQAALSRDPRWTTVFIDGTLTVFSRVDPAFIPDRLDDPATRR
ncbi:MAG: DUF2079 domain-containing protein [Candidatus Kerfeldbacteria bacterium]|nr:DUF2079 domain-containing protein [Candidatus Kerfeldbacteria bacterium]